MPHRTVLARQILPAIAAYLGLIAATLIADLVLHRLGLLRVGRYLGPVGTLLIVASFAYSLRKRKLVKAGSPKTLLQLHETLGWLGAWLVLVHAGIHVHALLPWLATVAMLVVVASGFVGKLLVRRAGEALAAGRQRLGGQAPADPALERRVLLDALTVDAMKRWRVVHMPLNAVFLVLTLVHVVAVLAMWRW
jgi:hypothetical protein